MEVVTEARINTDPKKVTVNSGAAVAIHILGIGMIMPGLEKGCL